MTLEERITRIETKLGIGPPIQDHTVIDPDTGLMWQAIGSELEITFEEAVEYTNSLNEQRFGGYNDWRIPTIAELFSLIDFSKRNPCIKNLPNIQCDLSYYWSSTNEGYNKTHVRVVNFCYGGDNGFHKTETCYVRCVRLNIKEEV